MPETYQQVEEKVAALRQRNRALEAERDALAARHERALIAGAELREQRDALAALLNEAQGFIVPDTAWDYTTDAGGYLYDRIEAALKGKP